MSVSGAQAPACQAVRVVIVDDAPDLLRNISECLRLLGFSVVSFQTAELALDHIHAQPSTVDIVIADLDLPGLSGLQMAQNLKAAYDIPFILSSGTRVGTEPALLLVDRILFKPTPVTTLAQVATMLVEKKKSSKAPTH